MVGNVCKCGNSGPVLFITNLNSVQAKEFAAAFSGLQYHNSDVENLLDIKGGKLHKQKSEFLTHRKAKSLAKWFCYECF